MKKGLTDSIALYHPAVGGGNSELFKDNMVYILENSPKGTLGVNLNRFYSDTVDKLFAANPELSELTSENLLLPNIIHGGPLQPSTPWILQATTKHFDNSFSTDSLCLSTSKDAFTAHAENNHNRAVIGVGMIGWGPGQFEKELALAHWQHFPADFDFLSVIPFNDPPLYSIHMLLRLKFNKTPSLPGK